MARSKLNSPPPPPPGQADPPIPPTPEEEREQQRELRASTFAEKHGIVDERQALLAADEEYRRAVTENKGEVPEDVRQNFEASMFAWRNALAATTRGADKQDRIAAHFIGVRDTTLRLGELKQFEKEEALNGEGKKAFFKALSWAGKTGGGALKGGFKGYSAVTELAGTALGAKALGRRLLGTEERAQRAARIVGSAALVSALVAGTGGVGAVPIVIDALIRIARGSVGIVVGTAAGAGAGKVYSHFAQKKNARSRQEFLSTFKSTAPWETHDIKHIEKELESYEKGTRAALAAKEAQQESRRQLVEMSAATVAGGGYALGGNLFITPEFFGVDAVQNAQETLADQSLGGGDTDATPAEMREELRSAVGEIDKSSGESAPEAAPVAEDSVPPAAFKIEEIPADRVPTITSNEGAYSLFGELKTELEQQYEGETEIPPAVRGILNADSQELADKLGFADADESRIMHVKDTLRLNAEGQIVFHDNLLDRDTILIERNGDVSAAAIKEISGDPRMPNPTSTPPPETPVAVGDVEAQAEVAEVSALASPDAEVTEAPKGAPDAYLSQAEAVAQFNGENLPASISEGADPFGSADSTVGAASGYLSTEQAIEQFKNPGVQTESAPLPPSETGFVSQEEAVAQMKAATEQVPINTHGVPLDSAQPELYTHIDTNSNQVLTMYGGGEESHEAVEQLLREDPKVVVRYERVTTDALGRQSTSVVEAYTGSDGTIQERPAIGSNGVRLERIDPNAFTGKSQSFIYKRQ